MTDKETIESMLYELATPKNMGSFFVNNATSDFLLIRPSGNPISAKGFEEMMSSGDVVQEKAEITKIHRFEFLSSDVAMCVFTLGAKFYREVSVTIVVNLTRLFLWWGKIIIRQPPYPFLFLLTLAVHSQHL